MGLLLGVGVRGPRGEGGLRRHMPLGQRRGCVRRLSCWQSLSGQLKGWSTSLKKAGFGRNRALASRCWPRGGLCLAPREPHEAKNLCNLSGPFYVKYLGRLRASESRSESRLIRSESSETIIAWERFGTMLRKSIRCLASLCVGLTVTIRCADIYRWARPS